MSAINNAWNGTSSKEDETDRRYQNAIASVSSNAQGLLAASRAYRADRWETGTATTRFTVTKASNGYILETGDEIYVADTVEQVQGIVATLLIAKAE